VTFGQRTVIQVRVALRDDSWYGIDQRNNCSECDKRDDVRNAGCLNLCLRHRVRSVWRVNRNFLGFCTFTRTNSHMSPQFEVGV
jgi:hypothetical protein